MTTKPKRVESENGGRTLASIYADTIRHDIIRGALRPQAKLNLRELAARYGVGVIPLREALSRLATTGFVTAEDGRGFRVSGVSPEEIADVTRVRTLIEGEALRDAIEHGDVEWEARILAALHRLSRTPMIAPTAVPRSAGLQVHSAWESAHGAFHQALLSACRSPWLLALAGTLRDQADRYRYLTLLHRESPKRDVAGEHKAIAEAAVDRHADEACRLLAAHLHETTRRALAHSASGGRLTRKSGGTR